jgi:hypothetical protein
MKYSLRSLMIVALVIPPLIGLVAWRLIPPQVRPVKRGTPTQMERFLRIVKEPYPSEIHSVTNGCFEIGAPASRYQKVLAAADAVGTPDQFLPGTMSLPTGKQYIFWCEGKNPKQEGDAFVVVIVAGNPSLITHAWVNVWQK